MKYYYYFLLLKHNRCQNTQLATTYHRTNLNLQGINSRERRVRIYRNCSDAIVIIFRRLPSGIFPYLPKRDLPTQINSQSFQESSGIRQFRPGDIIVLIDKIYIAFRVFMKKKKTRSTVLVLRAAFYQTSNFLFQLNIWETRQ